MYDDTIYNYILDDTILKSKGEHSYLYNMKTGTVPLIIHGNGPIKVGHVLINWSKKNVLSIFMVQSNFSLF